MYGLRRWLSLFLGMSLTRLCILWSRLDLLLSLLVCCLFAHQRLYRLLVGVCTPSRFPDQTGKMELFSHGAWRVYSHVSKVFARVQIYVLRCALLFLALGHHLKGNL